MHICLNSVPSISLVRLCTPNAWHRTGTLYVLSPIPTYILYLGHGHFTFHVSLFFTVRTEISVSAKWLKRVWEPSYSLPKIGFHRSIYFLKRFRPLLWNGNFTQTVPLLWKGLEPSQNSLVIRSDWNRLKQWQNSFKGFGEKSFSQFCKGFRRVSPNVSGAI